MADPLSVTAGVVGIVVPALHGVRLLLEDLQQLRDASKTVKRLTENVQAVDTALQLLKGVEEREWKLLGDDVAQESKVTISSCTQACDTFRANLQRWTRHSSDGKLVMQDRAKVALLKKAEINTMVEQLANCKLTINTVVSIATFSVRNTHMTDEIKQMISAKQTEVEGALVEANQQRSVVQHKLEELSDDDDEEVGESEGSERETMRQLREVLNRVEASQKLLSELLYKSQEEFVAKAAGHSDQSGLTTVTFGSNNSGFQANYINGGVSGLSFGVKPSS
ncbi:Cytochrome P450 protein [Rutstroemia sp. NJR-2017a BBW]|nr:Cytochrome P450 protein [Rutstroemia sp. NJR-2017a BBW]